MGGLTFSHNTTHLLQPHRAGLTIRIIPVYAMRPLGTINCVMWGLAIQSVAPTNELEQEIEELSHCFLKPRQHGRLNDNLNVPNWYTIW